VNESAKEIEHMDKTARIAALVASKKLGPAMTVKVLESLTDEQITAIENAATTAVADAPVAQTEEQYINAAPAALRDGLRETMRVASEKRTAMVSRLKASGRCDYTDAELAVATITDLERLSKLAGIEALPNTPVDFSLNGARTGDTDNENVIPAAPSLFTAIQNRRATVQ
jgi:hypothetical protein